MANRRSQEDIISEFKSIHGERYDYGLVEYKGMKEPIIIRCRSHGTFVQRAADHISGSGCRECAIIRQSRKVSKPASHFIERARTKLGDSVDYSLIPANANGNTLVTIICNVCGKRQTKPLRKLAEGHGCGKCQEYGFCENKPGYIYLLTDGSLFKIGITNREVEKRVREIEKSSNSTWIVLDKFLTDGYHCRKLEETLLNKLQTSNKENMPVFSGYTETFTNDDKQYVERVFKESVSDCPKLGELYFVPKPPPSYETPEQRRERLEKKTGLPVGVVRKYGRWYFQQIVRINGKKDKKPLGSFEDLSDCCEYAKHYWNTGELLDTTKNLMVYNKFGLPKNISPCFGGYRVQVSCGERSKYVGTFPTLELAIEAKTRNIKELSGV